MSAHPKLIVTGGQGFVAGSVIDQGSGGVEVHAVSRGEPLADRPGLHWHRLDPLDPAQWAPLFRTVAPDAVVHTAAVADIDFCQAHPEVARDVNVGLTRTLVELCARTGAKLVFCSTDTVFEGEHAPYREEDAPGPVNLYAETKVQAEQCVRQLGARGVIARLALVYGLPVLGTGNSFLARMIAAFKAGREVGGFLHEVRTPVDVITVGRALLELAAGPLHGVFHLAGNDRLSRFEIAQRTAARFGFPARLVFAQAPTAPVGRAPRPRDVSFDNRKARAQLSTPMCSFDEGLSLILERGQNASR